MPAHQIAQPRARQPVQKLTTVRIDLFADQADELREIAERHGTTPERLAAQVVRNYLSERVR